MADPRKGINSAMDRLAAMLGAEAAAPTTTGNDTSPASTERPQTPDQAGDIQQRAAVAQQIMYSMGMPLLMGKRAQELTDSLPVLISNIKNYPLDPIVQRIAAQSGGGQGEELEQVMKVISSDLTSTSEERAIPVALAFFMAAYTIAHNWDR